MDYNMEYDHDDIATNHNMSNIAFMVNSNSDAITKHFNKDQYDEAVKYQMSYINNTKKSLPYIRGVNDFVERDIKKLPNSNNENLSYERKYYNWLLLNNVFNINKHIIKMSFKI